MRGIILMSGNVAKPKVLIEKIKKMSKIKLIITAIVLVLVTIGIWLYASGTINNWMNPKKDQSKTATNNSGSAPNEVASSIISGDYAASQAKFDKALSQITNPKDQAWVYIQKASVALNLNKYDDAYNFAKKAEELNPTESSAQMMAAAADKKGDKAEAIAKYKLAISRITGTSGMDDLDRQSLQKIIDKLEG